MELLKWTQPAEGIFFTPPNDFVPEHEKTPQWFGQMARWIVANFYNQPPPKFNNKVKTVLNPGIAQIAIDNWSYVFVQQSNDSNRYLTTDFNNNDLPVSWESGGKIASLVDYMKGTMLTAIDNIEVTAKNLSDNVTSERATLYEKLMIQYEMRDMVRQMLPQGVDFQPVSDPEAQLDTKEEIEKYVETWQDQYTIMAERIGQSQVESDDLKGKFVQSGANQIVSGLSSILVEVESGRVTNTVIPDFETIWDNRSNDPHNENALLCGYVKHNVPYQEVIRKFYNDLSGADIEEIRKLAVNGYSNTDEFLSYYNQGFGIGNQFYWWNSTGSSNMTVAYATVYFIAPRDWRYRNGRNKFGSERVLKINDNEEYAKDGGKVKGVTMPGDYSGWDLHQATIIGNKYIVNYGYANNVLRSDSKKGRPLLPMLTLCSGMTLNQGRSIVSKLIPLQNDLDAYAFKIKQKIANDYGKSYVFNGNKFDGVPSTEIVSDLKTIHVVVSTGSSGEPDDPQNAQKMVEVVDMGLDTAIIQYVNLRREVMSEMETIASVSRIALGQQGAVIGAKVQETTIAQNSYGTMTLMWDIMKHFNKVVQYNVNLTQLLYQFKDSVRETLIIGDAAGYLLDILNPQEFGTQKLLVFINILSTLDAQQREELRTIALSEAQNGRLDTVDFVEHIQGARTIKQAVKGLKYAKNKQLKELRAQQAAQSQGEMQHAANMQQEAKMMEAVIIQLKEDNANFRAIIQALSKKDQQLGQELEQQPPQSPLIGEMAAMQAQQQAPPQQI